MARIKFFYPYTPLVEHFFRVGVRYKYVGTNTNEDWFLFTKSWIGMLEPKDRDFIQFIFGKQYEKTDFGLYEYHSEGYERISKQCNYEANRKRLYELERKFAIDGGLIGEYEFDIKENN